MELFRLLKQHPSFEVLSLGANSKVGSSPGELYPSAVACDGDYIANQDILASAGDYDVLFSCLPHGQSMDLLAELDTNLVIDLGADFRLTDSDQFEKWYGQKHTAASKLNEWCYGLPELNRQSIAKAKRIANPGCYPTAISLALLPLAKEGLVEGVVVADAYSGTSGAGRGAKDALHFSHVFGNVSAYKVTKHQHTPEIEMVLAEAGSSNKVSFTPHLLPVSRGIHATCSGTLKKGLKQDALEALYREFYTSEPFVHLVEGNPSIKGVVGSNHVHLAPFICEHTGRVIVTSVIDNLVKGAAGQAIQNANIALGLSETVGLEAIGVYP